VCSAGAMMRARRGAAPRDASPSSPRGRHRDAASSPPPPATPRRGGAAGAWECCVCWEAQPAVPPRSARRAAQSQSQCGLDGGAAAATPPVLLPADSACGHGCCARCLRAYVASVVTSATRHGITTPGGAATVLCPGVDARTPAGWDARCHATLPPALLAQLLPCHRHVVADALSRAWAWARAALAAVLPAAAGRTALCPWCGAAGESGSRGRGAAVALVVRCAACGRHRCRRCGTRLTRRSTRCAVCRAAGRRLATAVLVLMLSALLALLWRPAAALLAARARLRAHHGLQPPEPR